ncbi:UTP--glucose-1-phosphate uridylyltransferase [Alteribacter natronophilus]|uniref:UTP--glucose-1-phosphate uridylyltransferase n=1 Tax=Alteribacter natronophilus TaxID=2583810 RepID=UPI00110F4556|nr:UTP--glucose-1-phosphate uridylyltransferase [Alteribacter natronophilus]TMW72945.1 UTP--glucose-1-phosphate uridylyltransferase [Alteribacter natronophilus]
MEIRKAIIPAAGYGTRSLPITKVLPKEMFPVAGKPAIHHIVEEASLAGINEILIVVSRNKNMILDYFDRSLELEAFLAMNNKEYLLEQTVLPDVHIQYVRQPFARGLGDAVLLGERFAGSAPFAVLLPDDLFVSSEKPAVSQVLDAFTLTGSNIVGVQKAPHEELHQYGVAAPASPGPKGSVFALGDLVEKPKKNPPSNLAVCGRYAFTPEIFSYLKNGKPGAGGEIQLTDAMKSMLGEHPYSAVVIEGERFDLGKEDDYYRAIAWHLNRRNGS